MSGVPGPVNDLHAEYYYFHDPRDRKECFRAALRISWSTPRIGLLFLRCVLSYEYRVGQKNCTPIFFTLMVFITINVIKQWFDWYFTIIMSNRM